MVGHDKYIVMSALLQVLCLICRERPGVADAGSSRTPFKIATFTDPAMSFGPVARKTLYAKTQLVGLYDTRSGAVRQTSDGSFLTSSRAGETVESRNQTAVFCRFMKLL